MSKFVERNGYRLRHNYRLVFLLTGDTRRNVRLKMSRKGLDTSDESFAVFLYECLDLDGTPPGIELEKENPDSD